MADFFNLFYLCVDKRRQDKHDPAMAMSSVVKQAQICAKGCEEDNITCFFCILCNRVCQKIKNVENLTLIVGGHGY